MDITQDNTNPLGAGVVGTRLTTQGAKQFFFFPVGVCASVT